MPALLPASRHGPCEATQLDALDAISRVPADVVYLDPPYNQHSYLGNYHVWESLVLWDKPAVYGVACKRMDVRDMMMERDSTVPKLEQLQRLSDLTTELHKLVRTHHDETLAKLKQHWSGLTPKKDTLEAWAKAIEDARKKEEVGTELDKYDTAIKSAKEVDNFQQAMRSLHDTFRARLSVPYFHMGRSGVHMLRATVAPDVPGSTAHWDAVGAVVDKMNRGWGPESASGNRDVYMRFQHEGERMDAAKAFQALFDAGHLKEAAETGRIGEGGFGAVSATPLFLKKQIEKIEEMPGLERAEKTHIIGSLRDTWLASQPETSSLKASMFRDGDLGRKNSGSIFFIF